jgi:hypothetical protein
VVTDPSVPEEKRLPDNPFSAAADTVETAKQAALAKLLEQNAERLSRIK